MKVGVEGSAAKDRASRRGMVPTEVKIVVAGNDGDELHLTALLTLLTLRKCSLLLLFTMPDGSEYCEDGSA